MFTIQHATLADIPLIRQLCFQVWPQTYAPMLAPAQIEFMLDLTYSPASLQQQLDAGSHFLIGFTDAEPVGFAAYKDQGDGLFKLEKLYVLLQQQGKGFGRCFIDAIVELSSAQGGKVLQLQVNKQNSAKQFYEKLGFTVAQAAVFTIGNGYVMDDYVMELPLNALR
jgi:diamine N-acetyltransferase